MYKGTYLLTADDMTFKDFLEETKFMASVHATFPRPFRPSYSRPKLQKVGMTPVQMKAIKELFFDADGSLSDAIRKDIDTSAKHGYINFQNSMCFHERRDLRWQVPIRKHGFGT